MSNMTNYTPGPWRIINSSIRGWDADNGEYTIAKVIDFAAPHDVFTKANARLIAAAPDLLSAAKSFAKNGWDGLPTCTYQDFEKLIAAIIKAEGK